MAERLKANLAQKPSGGDREVARDIAAGKCDIGIGNTYYWALMNDKETDKKPWADATKVILPTFQGGGTHVNISGVVLAKHAPNRANAVKLIEWLAGEKAQQIYADRITNIRCAPASRSTRQSPATASSRPIRCRSQSRRQQARPPRAGGQGRLRQLILRRGIRVSRSAAVRERPSACID